jgi:hypothetical protein
MAFLLTIAIYGNTRATQQEKSQHVTKVQSPG